jgi:hypothetical protein
VIVGGASADSVLSGPHGVRAIFEMRCSATQLSEKFGAPERSRTPNPQIRSLVLYPIELRARAEKRAGSKGSNNYSTGPCQARWIAGCERGPDQARR